MPRTKFISDSNTKAKATFDVEEEVSVSNDPVKKEFRDSDGIKCRSVVSGNLFVEGIKTSMVYSWTDYGDVSEMEYRDLVAAVRSRDKSIYEPRIIVEDKDFLAEFPALDKFYSDRFKTKDIRTILEMPVDEMLDAIDKLPNGAKESVKSLAAKQVASGELDSVNKIKALDKVFGTDLNLIGSFSNDED